MGQTSPTMQLNKSVWGHLPDGRSAHLFTLTNDAGAVVKLCEWGAALVQLTVPDRHGVAGNVVLGFDSLARYLQPHPFFGVIAGRYANRIRAGQFTLNGKTYSLARNNGLNHLHGGLRGFDKQLWSGSELGDRAEVVAVQFTLTSPDGDEGYPGALIAQVTYSLTAGNTLRLEYQATTSQSTVLNLTNHSYFNLAGEGTILEHELTLNCSRYTPVDGQLIPLGNLASVAGTPLDFRQPTAVGARGMAAGLQVAGYDHNFVLDRTSETPTLAARLYDPKSGRVMECHTTEPGVQLYTFNNAPIEGIECAGGKRFFRQGALCLETQHFPNSPNVPGFPTVILEPGKCFRSTTEYRFVTR